MKRLLILAALVLGLAMPAFGQDFDAGLAAYTRGDFVTALREWTPLAEQGDADAQYKLGVMYASGRGVPQDDAQAVAWYRRAAEQEHARAQYNLGVMYDDGRGVPQDDAQAVAWYRRAAEQDVAEAQFNLGFMYDNGRGVAQNYVQAHMWWNLAAAQGIETARKGRDIVAERMTPADISKAQRLAREWKPKSE